MISLQTKNSYSEVFELLKYIDRKDLNKIPMNLLETIKENRNENYNPNIDINDVENSLSKKAMALYLWLYLTYLEENQEEKDRVYKVLNDNDEKVKEKIKINENIFKKKEYDNNIQEEIELVEYKQNILTKIMNMIKKFFKRGNR